MIFYGHLSAKKKTTSSKENQPSLTSLDNVQYLMIGDGASLYYLGGHEQNAFRGILTLLPLIPLPEMKNTSAKYLNQ